MTSISKQKAKELFEDGKEIMVYVCNLRSGLFGIPMRINKKDGGSFDDMVNAFYHYSNRMKGGNHIKYCIKED